MGGYQDISRYFELLPRKMMVIKIFPGTQDLMEERCCLHSVFAPQDLYSRSDIVLPDRAKLLSKNMYVHAMYFHQQKYRIFNARHISQKVLIKLNIMAR